MRFLKKILSWCPQPKYLVPANFARLSTPIFAGALLVEIVILLIVPMAYYALLVPKNIAVAPDQTLPLTDSQIKAAWPNLPTAQEIVNGSFSYSLIDSRMPTFDHVKSYTWISPVNAIPRNYPPGVFVTRLVPVEYFIWLKLNNTTWVSVDLQYFATNNPPYSLPSPLYRTEEVGFLGTGLPAEYVVVTALVIIGTFAAGVARLLVFRKKASPKLAGE